MSIGNIDIDKSLHDLPDEVSNALEGWLLADLNLEEKEAALYAEFKLENSKYTVEDIKSKIRQNNIRHELALKVILARTKYKRLNERLMAIKKQASMGGPR